MQRKKREWKKRGWIQLSELKKELKGVESKERIYMHILGRDGFLEVEIQSIDQMAYGVRLKGTLPANFGFSHPPL